MESDCHTFDSLMVSYFLELAKMLTELAEAGAKLSLDQQEEDSVDEE